MAPPPEEKIDLLAAELVRGIRCLCTDYIDMEYVFEGDPDAQAEVLAVRMNAEAQAHRVIADAAEKIAQIANRRRTP